MLSEYLKYCLLQIHLNSVFKGIYKTRTSDCFNRFVEDLQAHAIFKKLQLEAIIVL